MTTPTDRYALQERRAEYAATAAAAGIDADLAPLDALIALEALLPVVGSLDTRAERAAELKAYQYAHLDGFCEAFADLELMEPAEQLLTLLGAEDGCGERAKLLRQRGKHRAKVRSAERRAEARRSVPLAEAIPVGEDDPGELSACVMPEGYRVDAAGQLCLVVKGELGFELVPIASRPVFIVGASRDLATGEFYRDVSWRSPSGDREVRRTVPRGTLADARLLLTLAGAGAPVHSLNARKMVSFLARFEAANATRMVPRLRVDRMGWVDPDGERRALVVGRDVLGAGAGAVEVCPAEGTAGDLDGWRPKGTQAAWVAAVSPVLGRYPVPGALYLAALASPLVALLGCPSFVVDLSGETSHGKTTALLLAASVWGDPREGRGVLHSWDGTEVAVERRARMVGNLPLLLDETKLAGGSRARDPGRILYRLASGRGKDRGSPDGLRDRAEWCFVALSTGEAPVTATSEHAGTRGRVLSITELPFGPTSPEGARTTRALVAAVAQDHGHAGRALAAWLVAATPADLEKLKARYAGLVEAWTERLPGGVAARLAALASALLLAGELAQEVGLPCPDLEAVSELLERAIHRGATDADRPRAALADLLSWLGANPERVVGLREEDRAPQAGWLGKQEPDVAWSVVAKEARVWLARQGYDAPGIIRSWGERGWLRSGSGNRPELTVRLKGAPVKCLVVTWAAAEEVMDVASAPAGGQP